MLVDVNFICLIMITDVSIARLLVLLSPFLTLDFVFYIGVISYTSSHHLSNFSFLLLARSMMITTRDHHLKRYHSLRVMSTNTLTLTLQRLLLP